MLVPILVGLQTHREGNENVDPFAIYKGGKRKSAVPRFAHPGINKCLPDGCRQFDMSVSQIDGAEICG